MRAKNKTISIIFFDYPIFLLKSTCDYEKNELLMTVYDFFDAHRNFSPKAVLRPKIVTAAKSKYPKYAKAYGLRTYVFVYLRYWNFSAVTILDRKTVICEK